MIIKVNGTAYEQGLQHGEKAKELIQLNVDTFKGKVLSSNVNLEKYYELMEMQRTYLEKIEPDIIRDIEGIAEASGIDFLDILLINIPLYFMLGNMPQECSMILARGQATLDHKTYLLKNRDMRDEMKHVILEREYVDGLKIIEVNGAGIVTFPGNGMNSHGLAVATTGVWPRMLPMNFNEVADSTILLNTSLILRNCKTLDEAITYIDQSIRMNGMNFIIADKTSAAAIEVTKNKVFVEMDQTGIMARTNHYKIEDLVHLNPTFEEYPSTHKRCERIESFLNDKHGEIRLQEMIQIASDHENGPENGICRHGAGNDGITVYMSVMVAEDEQVWTTLTNPCQAVTMASL